jgi:CBS domain-containing protein
MTTELIRDYRARDFMSREVATIREGDSVRSAIELMVSREVGSLAVTGGGGARGVFTERDLVEGLADGVKPEEVTVRDLMDAVVSKIRPSLSLKEAARAMVESKGRLLVYDEGELAGIVTASDIIGAVWRVGAQFDIGEVTTKKVVSTGGWMPVLAVVKMMEKFGVGSVILESKGAPRGIFTERDLLNHVLYPKLGLDQQVIRAGSVPLVSADVEIRGKEAVNAMITRKIKRLPLTRDGKVVGMVTARDIVEAFGYAKPGAGAELEAEMSARYGELCPICNTRIDDRGLCGCGTIGGD